MSESNTEPETDPAPRPARGWLSLYAVSFVLVLVAAGLILLAARSLLEDIGLLTASSIVSGLAILVAILAVFLPRRSGPVATADPEPSDGSSGTTAEEPDPEVTEPDETD